MKAIWNGQVIAESEDTIAVEGNHYFPESSLKRKYIKDNTTNSYCPWKGTALYYSLRVDGKENHDAVWYYPNPSDLAKGIKNWIAFWKGVEIEK